ncbi:hypothetical protein NDU88_004998 [Pleurodeles waltl]|uniref:Uncharacterized protein n=1 Tax=Pleurodeles waltl TaxID=8319 RepID=A0AAV7SKE4_PLEWA|nr:hypothetical protein NDU88_004998 [Pleurodeles waltl]
MRRVRKQEDDTALTCLVMVRSGSRMKPRLRAWSEGVGAVPRAVGHEESSQAVGLDAGGVLGEGKYQLSVVGVGGDVDVVFAYDVGEGAHVDIEESRAERGALWDAADDLGGV